MLHLDGETTVPHPSMVDLKVDNPPPPPPSKISCARIKAMRHMISGWQNGDDVVPQGARKETRRSGIGHPPTYLGDPTSSCWLGGQLALNVESDLAGRIVCHARRLVSTSAAYIWFG